MKKQNDAFHGLDGVRLVIDVYGGIAGIQGAKLSLRWIINEADSSCWRRPLELTIGPIDSKDENDEWETCVDLRREDARLLRDFLTSVLASPDLREDEPFKL